MEQDSDEEKEMEIEDNIEEKVFGADKATSPIDDKTEEWAFLFASEAHVTLSKHVNIYKRCLKRCILKYYVYLISYLYFYFDIIELTMLNYFKSP